MRRQMQGGAAVPRLALAFAAAAPLPSLLAQAWANGLSLSLLWHLVLALPLVSARRGRVFRLLCLVLAAPMLVLTVVLNIFLLFAPLPGALLLLVARGVAGPDGSALRRRRYRRAGASVAGVAIGGWGLAALVVLGGAPDTFIVEVRNYEALQAAPEEPLTADGTGIGPEVTSVSTAAGSLHVSFDSDLSRSDRNGLRQRLQALPGVGVVRLCRPARREC